MTEVSTPPPPDEAIDPAVAVGIGRCAEALLDVDRLRGEVNALRALPGRAADFASALFDLEAARKGDADARANMLETADRLLVYWKDRSGDALAATHPTLGLLWADASALLVSFEVKRFKRALKACWEARSDAATLKSCIDDLQPEGNQRVEFARCLYHLELARLFVDESRLQFARRVQLVQEAYLKKDLAQELVGDDEGLDHLWKELVPYLDEFFEAQEQEEARARRAAARTDPVREAVTRAEPAPPPVPDVEDVAPPLLPNMGSDMPTLVEPIAAHQVGAALDPPPAPPVAQRVIPQSPLFPPPRQHIELPSFRALMPGLAAPPPPARNISAELEMLDVVVEAAMPAPPPPPDTTPRPAPPPPLGLTSLPAPPRPPDTTPPPGQLPVDVDLTDEVDEADDIEIVSMGPISGSPPPPPRTSTGNLDVITDYEPAPRAKDFWQHTVTALGLLPNTKAPRGGQRVLAAGDRNERKKLNSWLEDMEGQFTDVPDAQSMQCLLKLYLASHLKEKTLFGAPNPKRAEAFRDALRLLSPDGASAGRAAVWFELDGAVTCDSLQAGLEVVADFLQFCARQNLDPLAEQSPAKFFEGA